MRTSRRIGLVAALAALAVGCEEQKQTRKADDQLTIVVEADKTRIAAAEAALGEQRKTLEAERERLRTEIEKLDAAKGDKETSDSQAQDLLKQAIKLVREQEEMAAKREVLVKERDGLLAKVIGEPGTRVAVAAPASGEPAPAGSAPAAVASAEIARVTGQIAGREKEMAAREKSLAEREAALAERERVLAGREASIAQRDVACAAAASARPAHAPAGPGLSRAAVEKAYRAVLAAMDSKGVLAADLPAGKQKALREAAGFQKGDLAQAMQAVEQVEAAVEAIAIDGPFVSGKAKRVDALQRQSKNAKAREEVSRLLHEMARAYSDGRYAEANRALNNIVHLLEKGP